MEDTSFTIKNSASDQLLEKCKALYLLLELVDNKSNEWQSECGRLVALLAVNLLQHEIDDFDYLRVIVAIRRAQVTGVKEARKRNLNSARFQTTCPPDLALLNSPEDRRAAIELLSPIRAEWCQEYIAKCQKFAENDKSLLSLLVHWAGQNSSTIESFLKVFIQPVIAGAADTEFKIRTLKEAQIVVTKFMFVPAVEAGTAIFNTCESAEALALAAPMDDKLLLGLYFFVQSYIEILLKSCPLVLLEANFLAALQSLTNTFKTASSLQALIEFKRSLATSTASSLVSLLSRGGCDQADYWRPMFASWRMVYPTFKPSMDAITVQNPAIAQLFNSDADAPSLDPESSVIPIYARLLPEWYSYKSTLDEPGKVDAMDSMIREAASINGVEYLGTIGEVCVLDPILHQLSDGNESVPGKVKIVRPGVVYRRQDGSFRVLLTALVASHNLGDRT